MDFLVSFENCLRSSIGEVIDCCKANLSTQCEKERYLIDEEDIGS